MEHLPGILFVVLVLYVAYRVLLAYERHQVRVSERKVRGLVIRHGLDQGVEASAQLAEEMRNTKELLRNGFPDTVRRLIKKQKEDQ